MIKTTPIWEAAFRNEGTYEASMDRLLRASAANGAKSGALALLIEITALAHGVRVVSLSARTADLEELESLKFIYRSAPGRVDLV